MANIPIDKEKDTENVDPSLLPQISAVISTALYLEGKSSYYSCLCKSHSLCLWYNVLDRIRMYAAGSYAEGTETPWSDSDAMRVLSNVTVFEACEKGSIHVPAGNIVEMDTRQSRPGFTRLVLVSCVNDPADIFSVIIHNDSSILHVNNDSITAFLSSKKFAEYILVSEILLSQNVNTLRNVCKHAIHGPSISMLNTLKARFLGVNALQDSKADTVYAFRCNGWPSGAQEWYTRDRLHGWPPDDVIECIRQHDCHVVPVGDPTSKFSSEEWRISFVLGERELVWSFNDTQFQCYYILKCLLKLELDSVSPGQLSSYHLKNIMFWQCENYPESTWVPSNLLHCVQICLSALKKAVEKRKLDHFFDRRRNLLFTKFEGIKDRAAMIQKINSLLEDIINPVMQIIQQKRVLDAWNSSQNLKTFVQMTYDSYDPNNKAFVDFSLLCSMLQAAFYKEYLMNYPPIEALQRSMDTNLESGRLDQAYSKCFKYFLTTKAGMKMAILEVKEQSVKIPVTCTRNASDLFNIGSKFNAITGKLYLATYLFYTRHYETVELCLNEVLKAFPNKPLYYPGLYSIARRIQVNPVCWIEDDRFTSYSEKSNPFDGAVFDVIFSSTDTPVLPYVLKFEAELCASESDFFALHPAVYFYLLMFLNEIFLGNSIEATRCLNNLESIIRKHDNPYKKGLFRNFNLLGYCFSVMGKYSEAMQCYQRSLQLFQNGKNAAIYHALIQLQFYISKQEKAN